MNTHSQKIIRFMVITLLVSSVLFGCGKSENKNNFPIKQQVKKYTKATTLTGNISDSQGKVTAATIQATNVGGKILASAKLQDTEYYEIVIPADSVLPILLTATQQADNTNDATLLVAVIDPGLKRYDINPLTTAIAKKAAALGGYTYANMSQAAMSSTSVPSGNQTTGGFSGDPTRQYGGWH